MPIIIIRFTMYYTTTMSGSEENQARTLRTILPWTEKKMKSAKIRQARQQQVSPHPAAYRDDFG
jgi:hypothetical protein